MLLEPGGQRGKGGEVVVVERKEEGDSMEGKKMIVSKKHKNGCINFKFSMKEVRGAIRA